MWHGHVGPLGSRVLRGYVVPGKCFTLSQCASLRLPLPSDCHVARLPPSRPTARIRRFRSIRCIRLPQSSGVGPSARTRLPQPDCLSPSAPARRPHPVCPWPSVPHPVCPSSRLPLIPCALFPVCHVLNGSLLSIIHPKDFNWQTDIQKSLNLEYYNLTNHWKFYSEILYAVFILKILFRNCQCYIYTEIQGWILDFSFKINLKIVGHSNYISKRLPRIRNS
jgi:hypothetical protein